MRILAVDPSTQYIVVSTKDKKRVTMMAFNTILDMAHHVTTLDETNSSYVVLKMWDTPHLSHVTSSPDRPILEIADVTFSEVKIHTMQIGKVFIPM